MRAPHTPQARTRRDASSVGAAASFLLAATTTLRTYIFPGGSPTFATIIPVAAAPARDRANVSPLSGAFLLLEFPRRPDHARRNQRTPASFRVRRRRPVFPAGFSRRTRTVRSCSVFRSVAKFSFLKFPDPVDHSLIGERTRGFEDGILGSVFLFAFHWRSRKDPRCSRGSIQFFRRVRVTWEMCATCGEPASPPAAPTEWD